MDIKEKILELKEKRKAILLAHNYQLPEVQEIADYLGDSLGLSMIASKTSAEVIVFCGVYFMAETAKILSPRKKVLIPDRSAGCPMADMITAEQLRNLKEKHPSAKVLCYVNTPAEVKAECDFCSTSANAVNMVKNAFEEEDEIIFVPDKYLANYVASKTGRKLIPWQGYCPTHVKILPEDIIKQKQLHPQAEVIAHPECIPGVLELADQILSTEGMCRYAKQTKAKELIVATETGILYRLSKENPEKKFYPASELAICPNMKLITLEKVLWALQDMKYEVNLPSEIISKSQRSIQRMLEFAGRESLSSRF